MTPNVARRNDRAESSIVMTDGGVGAEMVCSSVRARLVTPGKAISRLIDSRTNGVVRGGLATIISMSLLPCAVEVWQPLAPSRCRLPGGSVVAVDGTILSQSADSSDGDLFHYDAARAVALSSLLPCR